VPGGAGLPRHKRDYQGGHRKAVDVRRLTGSAVSVESPPSHQPRTTPTTTTTTTGMIRRRLSSCTCAGGVGVGMVAAALLSLPWRVKGKEEGRSLAAWPLVGEKTAKSCTIFRVLRAPSSGTTASKLSKKLRKPYQIAGTHAFLLPLYTTETGTGRASKQGKEQAATHGKQATAAPGGWLLRGAARSR
jgi:hypothetical protein